MDENKKTKGISAKTIFPFTISGILIIISYIIYNYLPESDIANSIDQSSMTAVYLMIIAPALCLISLCVIALGFKKYRQDLLSVYKDTVVYSYFGVNTLLCIVCAVLETLFISSLFSLGFASPNDGTVYETYGIIVVICGIFQLISSILLSVKLKTDVKK